MTETQATPVADLSYEEAHAELVQIVQQLERGGTTLETSMRLWERGEELTAHCEKLLAGAKTRLEAAQTVAQEN
ncbi:MAG: exodeoxyribonuclease VII small subunit [Microbacteriaceae bacterium]|nr:exodeoxyribonuclease VII small subunit [Microbacteriaceae bacterium]